MDSQEAASNAIKSPTDRGESVVKTNTTLPPDFRAGSQGPTGLPRHPVNNGSATKLRPGLRPPVQIRFDNHSPGGQPSSGQFVQQRPYGPVKSPGSGFPRKPLQQNQNSPIILNPCFPTSPVQRSGLQIGPRPPHPGNFQAQQLQGNVQRHQQPRPEFQNTRPQQPPRLELQNTRQQQPRLEFQNIHQQAYNSDNLVRSREIVQKQLKRNESSLNISQDNLPSKREDKKSTLPRPVVDKMADVDDSKKRQQFENTNSKVEMQKNIENDDDDDVIMDGKKLPGTNESVVNQKESIESKLANKELIETVKRPETATINGKVNDKPDASVEKANEKLNVIRTDLNHEKSIEDSNMKESNNRLSSMKSHENVQEKSSDKLETGKIDNNLNESTKRLIDTMTENENMNKENAKRLATQTEIKSSPISAISEDKIITSDNAKVSAASEQSEKQLGKPDKEQNEQKLNVLSTSPEKVQVTTSPTKLNDDNSQQQQTPFKYPDKPESNTPAEQLNKDQNEQESKTSSKLAEVTPTNTTKDERVEKSETLSKSPEKLPEDTPTNITKDEKEEKPKTPSKSLDKSQTESSDSSPVKINENETKQELKESLKSPDKPDDKLCASKSAEVSKTQNEEETKALTKSPNISCENKVEEADKNQNKEELKMEAKPVDIVENNVPVETNEKKKQPQDEHESKSEMKSSEDLLKKVAETKTEEELNALSKKSDKSPTLTETHENQTEQKSNELTESSEKSNEKIPTDHSSHEEVSKDLSASKSANLAEESGERNIQETSHSDKLTEDVLKSNVVSSAIDASAHKQETNKMKSSPVPSPEEGVKGFDNGEQRSLVSPTQSPQSFVSQKSEKSSPDVEKLIDSEKKEITTVEKDDGRKTPESKSHSTCKATDQRVPTPTKLDERSEKKFSIPEIENGSVTNDSAQSNAQPTTNGVAESPTKKSPSKSKDVDKRSTAGSPVKSPSKSVKSLPRTPDTPSSTSGQEKKKLPMNKIQVGAAPSPNLKTVRSKIGSLDNASYKPGGGKVKIENRKLDFSKAQPKIAAKNEKYTPSGGDKKIAQVKLQWNAKPKVGSLENATYKPGGGDKKIETVKLDFKDKAKPKVGSKDNAKHVPGGGSVKSSTTPPKTPQDTNNDIQTQKIDIKAESKIGSLDNVKHKPGGGDKKIFNDKDYLRQTGSNVESLNGSGSQSPVPPGTVATGNNGLPTSDENLNQEC
ncbi:Microtubule-associated protein 2 [Anthophora quadrimaculata]